MSMRMESGARRALDGWMDGRMDRARAACVWQTKGKGVLTAFRGRDKRSRTHDDIVHHTTQSEWIQYGRRKLIEDNVGQLR